MTQHAISLVFCLLMALTLATPVSRVQSEIAFKIGKEPATSIKTSVASPSHTSILVDATGSLVQSIAKRRRPGPQALAEVHVKYNRPLTQEQMSAALKSLSSLSIKASVASTPEANDAEYLCPVTVGGQTLNLQFDTGSSDFWVFSSELAAAAQLGHDRYDPTKSTTAKKILGSSWNIVYSDGAAAAGSVYNDTVTVGGLAVPNQAVELASSMSSDFTSDTDCDGIFGLGFVSMSNIKPVKRTNYFFTATQQGSIRRTVFTADLKRGKPGSYDFGLVNPTKFTGSITYTPVDNSRGYWGFTSSGYGIDTTYIAYPMPGILDTGTSILLLPGDVVSAYWSRVPGAKLDNSYGAYTFPCTSTLPSFTVGVGSAKYIIPGSYMNYGPVSSTSKFFTCLLST